MARLEFKGLDEYLDRLRDVQEKTVPLCKRALYDGAAVLADAVRSEVQALPTTDRNGDPQAVFEYEKDGLLEGLGIAKMKDRKGYIYTRVDFDGYNRMTSHEYPKGHPNSMVARAINSGTSKRPKNPFMRRAAKKAAPGSEAAMKNRFDADLNSIMKG